MDAIAHFRVALAFQFLSFLVQRILFFSRRLLFYFESRKLVVQLVEKARDVRLLGPQPLARGGNDLLIQPKPFRRLNPG